MGSKIQSGLQLRVFLEAENLKEAINEGKGFADGIVSFITLVSGVGLKIPAENLAYEITPKVKKSGVTDNWNQTIENHSITGKKL